MAYEKIFRSNKYLRDAGYFSAIALIIFAITNLPNKKVEPVETISLENPCPVHLPQGLPTGTAETNDLIVRGEYCLSSNDDTKFADWVAFRLTRETITGSSEQNRYWKADPAIAPSETLEPDDYEGAYQAYGYDRGHLAPLASFRGANWENVNYLSNIVPQKAAFNRGAWKDLEEYERDLVREHGEVFVIVGTAYDDYFVGQLSNADEVANIPDFLWRIISYNGKIEAYIFPQETAAGTDFKLGETTVFEVEQ
ncbi:MAG: DNA/RNA non-specific endonuclease [Limnothrix sp. RL_2_0]|nr:DNA/RNA non-specific endonuclease [Limnothrix sp. RL_2_0]